MSSMTPSPRRCPRARHDGRCSAMSLRGGAFPFKRWPSFLSAGISWRREAKASVRSLHDAWADTTTPHGRLILTVLGGLAEFERHLIVARTSEGRKRAAARGVLFGRPRKLTAHQHRAAREGRRDAHGNRTQLRGEPFDHQSAVTPWCFPGREEFRCAAPLGRPTMIHGAARPPQVLTDERG